jgi:flavin reductase (DIM6/NTAB) family NADH-FMN oxidoreductase RutF
MFYETAGNAHGLARDPFKAIVVPRPVGWISTLSAEGVANLAPYSFFNAFSEDPFYVAFGSGGFKHTLRNVTETGEFAFNLASYDLRDAMNMSSTGSDVDEFEAAGLEKGPCRLIKSPRVLASPVSFECKHFKTVDLPGDDGTVKNWLVIGKVVGVHIDDRFIANGRVNTSAMRPIARLGYSEYATVDSAWQMRRPD